MSTMMTESEGTSEQTGTILAAAAGGLHDPLRLSYVGDMTSSNWLAQEQNLVRWGESTAVCGGGGALI